MLMHYWPQGNEHSGDINWLPLDELQDCTTPINLSQNRGLAKNPRVAVAKIVK